MTEEQKQKLIEYVEYVLQPIGGKFISFGNPLILFASVRSSGDISNIMDIKNKITVYYMNVRCDKGELVLSFMSDMLDNPRGAVWEACAHSIHDKNIVSEKDILDINERIIDLYKKNV